jgi:bifunctional non-homologous end joining protein LigD
MPRTTPRRPKPAERLATYRRKRDFGSTPEPQGPTGATEPPRAEGHRFVVQRHRATALHYDFRLEAAGVLLSWAVPKGPTLDPGARRLAMHVEDHPLEYFDFEGVIPAGEYGGGDVIVWDWGTWSMADDDRRDPIDAVQDGDLHIDLQGEKLRGRFALVRKGRPGSREQWLLIHKHDEHAVEGWDPADHPRSVKSGRTNDEVAAAPAATWSGHALWNGPTPDELDALDALGKAGTWSLGGHELKLTNLDKVLFPARRPHPAYTKRDLIRHYAVMAPSILPYVAGRPINLHRYPDGITKPGFWHKAVPDHAPDFVTRWRNTEADPGETQVYAVLDSPASLAWAANFGAIELHPWTSTADHPHQPTWAMIDVDPGDQSTFDDVLVLARLHRTALEHLGVEACPKVTGKRGVQIWVPVAEGATFDDTRAWVERLSRLIGETVPDMVSWEWGVAERGGRIRLDYTQNAINKTLVAPFSVRPAPGAPVSVPITWDELDDPELRPDRWTIADVAQRVHEVGDPLAPLVGRQQRLPSL